MGELGYAKPGAFSLSGETNFELKWPQCIRPYSRMSREDSQVKSVLKAVSLPVKRTTWRIDPNGASEDVVRLVAEDLRLPVLGEDGNAPVALSGGHSAWSMHLHWVLKMLIFGHAYFEVVFKEHDGVDRLHKLAYRPPESIAAVNVERDGGLGGIEQYPEADTKRIENIKIPVEHLLAYVNDPDDFSWLGTSELRAAYKHWVLKDRFLLREDVVLERNGMGVPVYTAATDDDDEMARGRKMAENTRLGRSAGGAVPPDAKFEIKGVSGQLVSPREAINYHDSQIARSVLAHFLNLEGKGGSYALAEVQADTFIQSLQTLAQSIADTANQYLVERMVNLAFDVEQGPYPLITFDPIGSKKELTSEALSLLINCGAIQPDKDLEEDLRRRGTLPPKQSLESALEIKRERLEKEEQMGVSLGTAPPKEETAQ